MSFALEDQLLLLCSRGAMTEEAKARASVLSWSNLDWDYILETSIAHGVAPLLYWGLGQLKQSTDCDPKIPVSAEAELAKLFRGNQSRNQRLFRVIDDIVGTFESAGVPALGLKDVQLAKEVYPDPGLRPMGDIDILIHRDNYETATNCLRDLGFTPLPSADIPYTLKYAWGQHFRRASDEIWIDLQWNVVQREWDVYHEGNFDFELERLWRGAKSMQLGTHTILVPNPEDMLFHLCLHLEGHCYSELILFCDIIELIRHYEHQLDWAYLIRIAKEYAAESSIYYVLLLTKHLFKTDIPEILFQELKPIYFNGNIFGPLYENLTLLHLSLDQIRHAAAPPAETMKKFEAIVRRQALGAMQVYKEIDAIASTFMSSGGKIIILDGTPSRKIIPDASLRPFEDIDFLILDHDLPLLRRVLHMLGFSAEKANHSDAYTKRSEATSVDPVLANGPTQMILKVKIEESLAPLIHRERADGFSKRAVALESIRAKLARREDNPMTIVVQYRFAALSAEELLVYLSAREGRRKSERLFGLRNLLEFFSGYWDAVDWQQVANLSKQCAVSESVRMGVAMVGELLDVDQIPGTSVNQIYHSNLPARVLEIARYDPVSWGRYAVFKKPFYFVFSFISIPGIKAKLGYLFKSLFGNRTSKPVLPRLICEFLTGSLAFTKRKERTARDFAYWIDSDLPLQRHTTN